MARNRTFLIALCISTLVVMGVIAAGLYVRSVLDPFDDAAFDSEHWAKLSSQERSGMARDLIRHHLPRGTSRGQVESLLGPPDEVLHGQDAGGNSLRGVETYSYGVGSGFLVGHDDNYLYIHFDAADRVIGAEINGY